MNIETLIAQLRKRCADGKQFVTAGELGVSPSYLNSVLKGRKEPGDKILRPLGLRKKVIYVERGSE